MYCNHKLVKSVRFERFDPVFLVLCLGVIRTIVHTCMVDVEVFGQK